MDKRSNSNLREILDEGEKVEYLKSFYKVLISKFEKKKYEKESYSPISLMNKWNLKILKKNKTSRLSGF